MREGTRQKRKEVMVMNNLWNELTKEEVEMILNEHPEWIEEQMHW